MINYYYRLGAFNHSSELLDRTDEDPISELIDRPVKDAIDPLITDDVLLFVEIIEFVSSSYSLRVANSSPSSLLLEHDAEKAQEWSSSLQKVWSSSA